MTQREQRNIVRAALRGTGMHCVSAERLIRRERPVSYMVLKQFACGNIESFQEVCTVEGRASANAYAEWLRKEYVRPGVTFHVTKVD